MNVLSLFDGMSCGQIALRELGIKVDKYFASEIDKYAIKQTQHNFPDTIQVGDVTKVKASNLPRIDLIIGGSPCQGFSFAGKRLNFNDPRSKLFFEFVRILNEIRETNPDVLFLLENVNMKREYLGVISEHLGVFPVNINSALVSAQNRNRWYWSNIRTRRDGLFGELWTDIPQPKDRGILLKDILQDEVGDRYYIKDVSKYDFSGVSPGGILCDNGTLKNAEKSNNIDANYHKGIDNHQQRTVVCVAMRGSTPDNPSDRTTGATTKQRLEYKVDGKTNCLTSVAKDNLIMQINSMKESGGKQPYQQNRVYSKEGKMPALMEGLGGRNKIIDGYKLRRLTPIECARLQTIPDWYKWVVSDTQIYRMTGNGWTIEAIKHIFGYINTSE